MRHAAALLSFLFLLGGCGYHVQGRGGNLPADVHTVFTGIFANKTLEPFIETVISSAVRERLIRGRLLQVVDRPFSADALLIGEVISYSSTPIAYDRSDNISRYVSQTSVSAMLQQTSTNRVLWKGLVSWSEEYPASQDRALQENYEAAAIRASSERIADELYYRLSDGF